MRIGVKTRIVLFKMQFDKWTLAPAESRAIKAAMRQLWREGILTREAAHDPEWITCRLVLHLSTAIVKDAIPHGTYDWTVTISKALSIVVQAALAARAGDITVSRHVSTDCCLRYKHITIRVLEDDDYNVTFDGKIVLAHNKKNKEDPKMNVVLTLDSLNHPQHNLIDPLKLILVMALRTGCALTTAIDDAKARRDGIIEWQFPDRPLLCRYTKMKHQVEEPAGVQQLLLTLNNAAKAARSAPQFNEAFAHPGHSYASTAHDITRRYVGAERETQLDQYLEMKQITKFEIVPELDEPVRRRKLDADVITTFLADPKKKIAESRSTRIHAKQPPRR